MSTPQGFAKGRMTKGKGIEYHHKQLGRTTVIVVKTSVYQPLPGVLCVLLYDASEGELCVICHVIRFI